jgi:hypothetical protein
MGLAVGALASFPLDATLGNAALAVALAMLCGATFTRHWFTTWNDRRVFRSGCQKKSYAELVMLSF